jgi:hypothetical protein
MALFKWLATIRGFSRLPAPMTIFDKPRQSALRRRSPLFSNSVRILPNAD